MLINPGLKRAKEDGYNWVVLTGGDYYISFGFEPVSKYDVILS